MSLQEWDTQVHKPLLSSTSYFATLQPGTISVKVFLRQMANVPAVCKRPVRTEPQPEPALREAAESAPGAPTNDMPGTRSSFAWPVAASMTH